MSDFRHLSFPAGSVPWLAVDRLVPDYNARAGGREVDKLVLIESSVGVPPDKIIQSNLWMLQTAAAESKRSCRWWEIWTSNSRLRASSSKWLSLPPNKHWPVTVNGAGIFQLAICPTPFPVSCRNVLNNLGLLTKWELQIDTLGISGAVQR